ncbi:flagellar basal body rod protein FlgB [Clostridium aminobutyricum]|uniref:Flagellar basal body rod protein FlgB n=1 Tax=Clostridium aminobutyricum TaxID=33953 RepID=A0A939IHG5_CLOAM|nr:flagellar basal body rod protein FlgB [Clostridium aminobutyricum]MBN7773727.1 flagellar basal body rod protein FlgB [Clostridium aminobutyricum]
MSWIDNNNMLLSQKSLDYLWEKQRIISENIANIDTPGYKSKQISFENELSSKLAKFKNIENPKASDIRDAILDTNVKIDVSEEESNRLDGNNVNLDVEQVELSRAQLQYQYHVFQINDQFSRIRSAIGKG